MIRDDLSNRHAAPSRSKCRGSAVLIILVIIAALAVAGGGLFYAAKQGLIEIPYLSPKPPSISEITDYLRGIRSAEITSELSVNIGPLSDEVVPMTLPENEGGTENLGLELGKQILSSLLESGDLSVYIKSVTEWTAESPDRRNAFSGLLQTGGISAQFELETLAVDGTSYLKVSKLPIPTLDISVLADKWIDTSGGWEEIIGADRGPLSDVLGSEQDLKKAQAAASGGEGEGGELAETKSALSSFWQRTLDYGVWRESEIDGGAEYNGQPAWSIITTLDAESFRQAILSLATDQPDGTTPLDEAEKAAIEEWADDPDTKSFLENLAANTTAVFLVVKKTGQPVSLTVNSVFAPNDEDGTFEDRQINAKLSVAYDKVGQTFSIEEPESPLTMKQVDALMRGEDSEEDAQNTAETQFENVEHLAAALWAYFDENESCPAKLQDLIGQKTRPRSSFSSYYVYAVPDDLFTSQPFPYRLTADGCEFDYQLAAPGKYVDADGMDLALHTANELVVSIRYLGSEDWDRDGLSVLAEAEIGTDPNSSDTDWDGYSDKQEADGGYDPLRNANDGSVYDKSERPELPWGFDYSYLLPPAARVRTADSSSEQLAYVKQIQTAMELYFADHGSYPPAPGVPLGTAGATALCEGGFADTCGNTTTYMGLVYASQAPNHDLCPDIEGFEYSPKSNGADYSLSFCLNKDVGDFDAGPQKATPMGIRGVSGSKAADGDEQVANVQQIQTAMELYFADHGSYPPAPGVPLGTAGATALCGNGFTDDCQGTTYFDQIPSSQNPDKTLCQNSLGYEYSVSETGISYTLLFCLNEKVGSRAAGPKTADPEGIH
jgi:type II secretory pathway pseudopilin PulG